MEEESSSAVAETVQAAAEAAADTIQTVTKGVGSETASILHLDDIKKLSHFPANLR